MSLAMINACKMAKVSPTQKLVLLCLADCHNADSGRCDPSISHIMAFSGLSNRAIATAISALESAGHLTAVRINGARSNYALTPQTSEPGALVKSVKPVNLLPKPVKHVHRRSTFTSEPPSKTSEPPAGGPVNLLPKPVNLVHTNREEHGIEPEGTGSTFRLEDHPPPKANGNHAGRGTQAELEAYAVSLGLPASDGAAMFHHWTANGWKNGNAPSRDWRAGMRKWKAHGWLPSQKAQARPRHRAYAAADVTRGLTIEQITQF